MAYIEIKDKSKCCGCSACAQKCPQNSIRLELDSEGFLYPKVDTKKCINCGVCIKTCPIENNNVLTNENNPPIALGGYNKNIDIKMESSSGGIFSTIAEKVLSNGGVVFGAAFDENIRLEHIMIDSTNDLDKLRRSKYVQSEIGHTYIQARNELEKGRQVLFTGTPCQIAGLYVFLNKSYNNLITIDLVCHGVPSPQIFKNYKVYLEQKHNSKIILFNFRDKKRLGWNPSHSTNAMFANGMEHFLIGNEDNYIRGFLSDIYLRPSCYNCKFSRLPRIADISLADFWGVSNYYPELNDDKGTSLVLINNKKGTEIIEKCSKELELKQVNLDLALKHNPCIAKPVTIINPKRQQFFKDYNKKGWKYVEKKYLANKPFVIRAISKIVRTIKNS